MEFKVIKAMKEYSNLYEMSEDGTIIKHIGKGLDANYIKDGKGVLTSEEGVQKAFGLKTLHWHSWNKALPYEPVVVGGPKPKKAPTKKTPKEVTEARLKRNNEKMEKEDRRKARTQKKAVKEEARRIKEKRRDQKMALRVRKGKLMSLAVKNKLLETAKIAEKNGNHFIEFVDRKQHIRTIIKKDNIYLVRIDTQAPSRCGRFFLNMDNDKHVRYDEEIHKKGYGNDNIVWPKLA